MVGMKPTLRRFFGMSARGRKQTFLSSHRTTSTPNTAPSAVFVTLNRYVPASVMFSK
jgi:hypothetical protein